MTRNDFLTIVILTALCVLVTLPVLNYPPGRDQGEFAATAAALLDGKVPYRDIWNPKPPMVFYTYAASIALFGNNIAAIRALDIALIVLLVPAFYWLGFRLRGRVLGMLAAVMFTAVYASDGFWTLSQNDGLALVPMVWAATFTIKASAGARGHWLWSMAAGMLTGVFLWFKYPFVMVAVALIVGYVLIAMARQATRAIIWRDMAAFVVGGCVVGFGVMDVLALQGAFDDWLESARVTADYAQVGINDTPFYQTDIWHQAVRDRWQQWRIVALLAGAWIVIQIVKAALRNDDEENTPSATVQFLRRGQLSPQFDARPHRIHVAEWVFVLVWVLAGGAAMLVQAKGYDYHWLPLLPPLVLLAADTLAHVVLWLRSRLVLAGMVTAILAIGFTQMWLPNWDYLSGNQSQSDYYAEFRGGEYVASESQVVVDYLKDRTTPGETLFVWGFRAEVYYLTGLQPATRFIFNFPLVAEWYPDEWRAQTVEQLWQTMPPYAIVMRGDFHAVGNWPRHRFPIVVNGSTRR